LRAAADGEEGFVRIQAVRAAWLLGSRDALDILWRRLGDQSWWVRRAAGAALLELGEEGITILARAARTHADRYARQMAAQTLLDHRPDLALAR
jgi:HEAT repeat protein